MLPILGTYVPNQVCVICPDIEKAKRQYAAFLGMEVPPTQDGGQWDVTRCEYMGQEARTQSCKMAFFQLGALQLELIEPYGGKSTWQDFLDETGGGLHHMGFQVEDINAAMAACEAFGMKMTQKGIYGDGSGMYVYYDARETLHCFIELLHTFPKA